MALSLFSMKQSNKGYSSEADIKYQEQAIQKCKALSELRSGNLKRRAPYCEKHEVPGIMSNRSHGLGTVLKIRLTQVRTYMTYGKLCPKCLLLGQDLSLYDVSIKSKASS